jgi:CubicO group peptidase (beta-lactamase class C family)
MNPPFYDLASCSKALVTAPLALEYLDMDKDRSEQLGFVGDLKRKEPLTVRMLLSHSSGLPPWLPYQEGVSVGKVISGFDKWGVHPLLKRGIVGTSVYSDLNFRSLADLLEIETGQKYGDLALKRGLPHRPWNESTESPIFIPDGPDKDTWVIAHPGGISSYPDRKGNLPHDANSRAGMNGHAGFGATVVQYQRSLEAWLGEGWAKRQAVPVSLSETGVQWGFGLWQVYDGPGRYGDILLQYEREGVREKVVVLEETTTELGEPVEAPELEKKATPQGNPTDWWMHTGFTGPLVFYHAKLDCVVGVLTHRRGPNGEMIDNDQRRARHYQALRKLL